MYWKNTLRKHDELDAKYRATQSRRLQRLYESPELAEHYRLERLNARIQNGTLPPPIKGTSKEKTPLSPLGFAELSKLASDPKDRGKTFKRCGTL